MALRTISKFARLANLQVAVDRSGNSAHVYSPHLMTDDIDRSGNINVWRIQKLLTNARLAAYHIPNPETGETFLEYDRFTENYYTFLASVETEVAREFYDLPDVSEWPGLDINFHLGYMGSASLNTVATLKNHKTGQELAWNTNTVVCVDKSTRKPAPIPDTWREKYGGVVIGNKKVVVSKLEVPSETSGYQVKVPWCDVDTYKHTNYLSYVRFCLDAAMDGISNGYFSKLDNDIFSYHVHRLKILYLNETLAGDIINVSTWENTQNPFVLHFDMKRGETAIFQGTMEFFEPL